MQGESRGGQDVLAVFGAMILGALIGGITALLLAPKAGEELRSDIGDAATRAKERAEEAKGQMAGKYEELRAKVDAHIKNHSDDAAKAAEKLAEDVQEEIDDDTQAQVDSAARM